MLSPLVRALRATGADLPFGDPAAGHPGVALESWFWRLTTARRVVLLAVTACNDADGEPWASVTLAALQPDGSRFVRERSVDGVSVDPGRLAVAAGEGVLRADADGLDVELDADASLHVRFDAPWRWPRRSLGGLGLGHVVPRLTQYWHPHLLGAHVRGRARLGGPTVRLDGATAYGEKNWGREGVPEAWWWGQAALRDDVVAAFAGGRLRAGPLRVPATALAVRVGDELLSYAPPLASIRTRVDREGWALDARDAATRVRIRATAPTAPFHLPVPVPAERRTELLSHQHEDGHLELTAWRGRRLLFRGATGRAGLERGGSVGD